MGCSLKAISIGFSGSDLIFEGLTDRFFHAKYTFCRGFFGINPQRSDHNGIQWNFFLRYRLEGTDHAAFYN